MKKVLFFVFVVSFLALGYSSSAQCTCNGSYVVIYAPPTQQQYYEPQQGSFQQPNRYYSQNSSWNPQDGGPAYYDDPRFGARGQGFANTLDNIERVVNVFGQVVGVFQQLRANNYPQQQYFQPQQQQYYRSQQYQYYSPPQQVYYSQY